MLQRTPEHLLDSDVTIAWRRIVLKYQTPDGRLACRIGFHPSDVVLPQPTDAGYAQFLCDLFGRSKVYSNVPDAIRVAEWMRGPSDMPTEASLLLLYAGNLLFS